MDFIFDLFSWGNLLYLILLILGLVLTLVTTKYRSLVKEITDVVEMLRLAQADGKITQAEKDKIVKEVLDVLKALVGLVWKWPFQGKKK